MTLEEYLKVDRQWPHPLRMAHAQMQLTKTTNPAESKFWMAVLAANDKTSLKEK